MNSKYSRLPQDASDSLNSENEKKGSGHRHQLFPWKHLIVSLSVVLNVVLSASVVLMMREKPTPTGFGEHRSAICVRVTTDRSQQRSTLSRPHGINSGGTRLTVPKTTPTATSFGKRSFHLTVSWLWTGTGRRKDSGRRRCTYQAITAKVSTCWKPITSCTVW